MLSEFYRDVVFTWARGLTDSAISLILWDSINKGGVAREEINFGIIGARAQVGIELVGGEGSLWALTEIKMGAPHLSGGMGGGIGAWPWVVVV